MIKPEESEEPSDEEQFEEFWAQRGCKVDEFNHAWGIGWQETDKLHPGFGTNGAYADQCYRCGIYGHEFAKNPTQCELKTVHVVYDTSEES